MTSLMDALAAAAARGVEVTVLTNDGEPPPLRFKWEFWTTRDSGFGRFRAAGYELLVQDCDGDMSNWELRRGRTVIAEGGTYECNPYYHFDACLMAAEEALMAEARRKLAERRAAA